MGCSARQEEQDVYSFIAEMKRLVFQEAMENTARSVGSLNTGQNREDLCVCFR
jgi:hypothetical protein